jgi:hypothetical protein
MDLSPERPIRLPPRYVAMSRALRSEVEAFFTQHTPEESVLVIDSTGPQVTRQYQILDAVGCDRLLRMKAIHGFSGGNFVLFVYLGLMLGAGKISCLDLGSRENERRFRRFHHALPFSVPRALLNLLRRKPAFESAQPVYSSLEYTLQPSYIHGRFHDLPANLHMHLGERATGKSAVLSHHTIADGTMAALADLPLSEIVAMSVALPLIYGSKGTAGTYFDPIYANDHARHVKRVCSSGAPTLVSTPWRSGSKGRIHFVRCTVPGNPKLILTRDLVKMFLNVRNMNWCYDVHAAFAFDRRDVAALS